MGDNPKEEQSASMPFAIMGIGPVVNLDISPLLQYFSMLAGATLRKNLFSHEDKNPLTPLCENSGLSQGQEMRQASWQCW